jgi:hypothetical protein
MNISGKLSNVDAWLYLFILTALVLLAVYIVRTGYKLINEKAPVRRQSLTRKLIMSSVFLILFVFFFFLNFGAGTPTETIPFEETGEYEKLQEIGKESTAEELEEDAENRKTKELRIQSDDSLRNEYLKKSEEKSEKLVEKYLND